MFNKKKLLLSTALMVASSTLYAATTPEQAAKLGDTLTPIGAEKAGNAAGTIPAWTGGLESSADRYTNPFASEQPLFTITAANMDQHKANLTPGQIAMLKKYSDSYSIPVYPSHRTAALPADVYAAAKENATKANLTDGGNGLSGFTTAVPFPVPENGLEVIWNHMTRYRGGALERTFVQVPVQANGSYTAVKINEKMTWPTSLEGGADPKKDENILFYFVQQVKAPSRLTGNVLLVHETMNQVTQPRQAWTYNAGQRRVRRAPQIAYDAPGTASDGQRTTDNLDLFNGAPDRYNWNLVGKQELYIPYNSFKLADRGLTYDDILKPGHMNPELTRYELHRVWKVEATLKEGERHIYAKRTFYIDEDTWQIAVVDHYDGRGELWRVGEAHQFQYRDANVPWLTAEALYDLQSGRYLVGSLTNEEGDGFDFTQRFKHKDFTPQSIRRLGK
ncbi:hypothetical protein XMA121_000350 [Marinobacterium sp. xm-a-121]|uniref:DUF1329 domain-containing protein n=1 Tax=unclassified Marinobacterium TaxID=2644139 RepID=UPI00156995A8|nr:MULTISPECIES: DUF1329 domain-containing protein [unclassified Marinobacterium]NRP37764.1 hypothetical protein [Marinobacterium sp. xm-a-121]NRP52818.1 hypothetical protein [Marinobacterium sp. xm-v-242]NRP77399.1 hypothetical protein [Marinobacterium sp. xm-m-383]NRP99016.1 hypothetical protein [Marinobacterium sp. xm-v-233]